MNDTPTPKQLKAAASAAIEQLYACPNVEAMKELMVECVRSKQNSVAAWGVKKAFGTSLMTGQMHEKLTKFMADDPAPSMLHPTTHQHAQAMVSHAVGTQFFGDATMLHPKNTTVFEQWFTKYPKMAATYREVALTDTSIKPNDIDTPVKLAARWCNKTPEYDHGVQAKKAGELLGIKLPMADELAGHAKPHESKTHHPPSMPSAPPRTPPKVVQNESLHR